MKKQKKRENNYRHEGTKTRRIKEEFRIQNKEDRRKEEFRIQKTKEKRIN